MIFIASKQVNKTFASSQASFIQTMQVLLIFLSFISFALLQPICEAPEGSRCFYISPNGNDSADGSFSTPWKVCSLINHL
jgi:hypothetical protein